MIKTLFILFLLFQADSAVINRSAKDILDSIEAVPAFQRQMLSDSLIAQLPEVPLIMQDSVVTFFYKGNDSIVSLGGDMNEWQKPGLPMKKIDGTDLWFRSDTFETDARLEYKFIINGRDWVLDSLNLNIAAGGFGSNSELRMPAYQSPPEIKDNPDMPSGELQDTLFYSVHLKNSRLIVVYLPPGYNIGSDSLPVILFHDGDDFLSRVEVPQVLDYLIWQDKVRPVIAVFIPPVDRFEEYGGSLRSAFGNFVMDELWKWLNQKFRVKHHEGSHATIGISAGGNIALRLAFHHPEVFGNVASQSGYVEDSLFTFAENHPDSSMKIYLDVGRYDIPVIKKRVDRFSQILARHPYQYRIRRLNEGHNWNNWQARLPQILQWFYPASEN